MTAAGFQQQGFPQQQKVSKKKGFSTIRFVTIGFPLAGFPTTGFLKTGFPSAVCHRSSSGSRSMDISIPPPSVSQRGFPATQKPEKASRFETTGVPTTASATATAGFQELGFHSRLASNKNREDQIRWILQVGSNLQSRAIMARVQH